MSPSPPDSGCTMVQEGIKVPSGQRGTSLDESFPQAQGSHPLRIDSSSLVPRRGRDRPCPAGGGSAGEGGGGLVPVVGCVPVFNRGAPTPSRWGFLWGR